MRADLGRYATVLARAVGWGIGLAAAVAPVVMQQVVERLTFDDRIGTVPVELSLSHTGVTVIDTGVLGQVYWSKTGFAGFGAYVRVTGPPEAGGSLGSYVDPEFLRVNAQVVEEPGALAEVYAGEFLDRIWRSFALAELLVALAGAVTAAVVLRVSAGHHSRWDLWPRARRVAPAAGILVAFVATSAVSYVLFQRWDGNQDVGATYAMPGVEGLSFSSPQTREVAEQVQPFVAKNVDRVRERASSYVRAAEEAMRQGLPAAAEGLAPREGEAVVLAEADPQGAFVGTDLREKLYPLLEEHLGEGSVIARTISGDVTSNGTVAEEAFVEREAAASKDIPTIAVKGDHDSEVTVEQLEDNGVDAPDQTILDVNGLRITGANDPEFKSLFGGLVTNTSGVPEADIGRQLRQGLEPREPVIVLLHQPEAAHAYLGVEDADRLSTSVDHATVPWDDGIDDVPPGAVSIGHLHDSAGPWVLWNTDTDVVTWTVVDQLGTSGGVEERPTLNRFSTPYSAPLKTLSVRLQYVNRESGLQTGYATLAFSPDGELEVSGRVDVGLPGGQPQPRSTLTIEAAPR